MKPALLLLLVLVATLSYAASIKPAVTRSLSERLEELAYHQELYALMWPEQRSYFQGRADGIRLAAQTIERK